jgi:hypothetical protein
MSGGTQNVGRSWSAVDSCLEQRLAFVGNVGTYETGGPAKRSVLAVEGSGGALANAYRFASHQAAVVAERGLGPPGPTVTYHGKIALEVNAGTSQRDATFIRGCFDRVYGTTPLPSSNPKTQTTTTQATGTTPTATGATFQINCALNAAGQPTTTCYYSDGSGSRAPAPGPDPATAACVDQGRNSANAVEIYSCTLQTQAARSSQPPASLQRAPTTQQPSSPQPPPTTVQSTTPSTTAGGGAGGAGIGGGNGGGVGGARVGGQ